MILWAEIQHGIGFSFLQRRSHALHTDSTRVRILSETETSLAIDADGQSSLLVVPRIPELIADKAHSAGVGLVTVKNMRDFAWLGQLADETARKGLVSLLSFQVPSLSMETNDLLALYSQGRTIVAFPNESAPLWLDMACAGDIHTYLMTHRVPVTMPEALQNAFEPVSSAPAGLSLLCWPEPPLSAVSMKLWGDVLSHASHVGAHILDPDTIHGRYQNALKHGIELRNPGWHSLHRQPFTSSFPAAVEQQLSP